jgi:hypothetical protein
MMSDQCPYHEGKLRDDLPPLTERIGKLLIDERGYPVPKFVQWIAAKGSSTTTPYGVGYPEFRIASAEHMSNSYRFHLCWVCGQMLGRHRAYVIGPMCCINLISAEPPSHVDCAVWSVKGCPFLATPQMKRREDDFTRSQEDNVPGLMIKRNPKAVAVWTTTQPTKIVRDPDGGVLFRVPAPPDNLTFYSEGRLATPKEILESILTGLPALVSVAESKAEIQLITDKANAFIRSQPAVQDLVNRLEAPRS